VAGQAQVAELLTSRRFSNTDNLCGGPAGLFTSLKLKNSTGKISPGYIAIYLFPRLRHSFL